VADPFGVYPAEKRGQDMLFEGPKKDLTLRPFCLIKKDQKIKANRNLSACPPVAGLDCEIPEKQKLALLSQDSNSLFFFSEFLRQTFPTNF
jgi:hypothetical protein